MMAAPQRPPVAGVGVAGEQAREIGRFEVREERAHLRLEHDPASPHFSDGLGVGPGDSAPWPGSA